MIGEKQLRVILNIKMLRVLSLRIESTIKLTNLFSLGGRIDCDDENMRKNLIVLINNSKIIKI